MQFKKGIREEECAALLKTFFTELRKRNKAEKEARRQAEALSIEVEEPSDLCRKERMADRL